MSFKELGISPALTKAITELGFTEPTPIQKKSIPILLTNIRDYVGLAQTGTGKTAAFGLPLIQAVDTKVKRPQALVLCPTRELCLQITKELEKYSKYVTGLRTVAIYGGASIEPQIRAIKAGAQIIVSTPGRLIDHMMRKTISLSTIKTVVLDEADEMLNMGFQKDIDTILAQTPEDKVTWLFSATMPQEVERIASRYMNDPFTVTIGTRGSSAQTIEHAYCVVKNENRYEALKRFLDLYPDLFGVLFVRTKRDAKDLSEKLVRDGYAADALHGDLSQAQRDLAMKKFRARQVRLLIATDVAARGIDVSDITHVFHYGIPEDAESYTHRSGRTGRAGKSGTSIALVHPKDKRKVELVERALGQPLIRMQIPNAQDVQRKQIEHIAQDIKSMRVKPSQAAEDALAQLTKQLKEEYSLEDLFKRLLYKEVGRVVKPVVETKDLNTEFVAGGSGFSSGRRGRRPGGQHGGMSRGRGYSSRGPRSGGASRGRPSSRRSDRGSGR